MKITVPSRKSSARRAGFNGRSETYPVSKAKTYLGRLMDKAEKGETVYIVRGSHRFVLQPLPEVVPIPLRPPGYFADCYTREEIQRENRLGEASVVEKPADLE
jgi:hypothetical protein